MTAETPTMRELLQVMQPIRFMAPHGPAHCCGCWNLMVDVVGHNAVWQCNECGELREVMPPGETL